ncbi:MAG: ADP-ribosylglycohydrolase [Armatimonadia bacterium]|nr:ADP-ribosylglycohydrolase [Armatimonadia bacterium]
MPETEPIPDRERFRGMVLGAAVGDAIGLPREGLTPGRASRMFGPPPLSHRLLMGRGMVSDDTEHLCMVAQALLRSEGDPRQFQADFARRLKRWMLGLPAGTGLATLKACLRLLVGFAPSRSGVDSAGNGPAMRSAPVGLWSADDQLTMELTRIHTRISHTHPRAEQGALTVALAAGFAARRNVDGWRPPDLLDRLDAALTDSELRTRLAEIGEHLEQGSSAADYAAAMGWQRGVTGYIGHSVPASLFCWLRHRDCFRESVEAVISLGGDADSTGAITGALAGSTLSVAAIPNEWLTRLIEWPRDVRWMTRLADRVAASAAGEPAAPMPGHWPGVVLRNPFFTAVILAHGLRRLLPPYG